MRLYASSWFFWRGGWNIFDFLLTALNVAELFAIYVIGSLGPGASGQFRVLSGLRLLRLARLVRVMSNFPEFVVLIRSLGDAVRSTGWIAFMTSVIMTICAVLVRKLVWQAKPPQGKEAYY